MERHKVEARIDEEARRKLKKATWKTKEDNGIKKNKEGTRETEEGRRRTRFQFITN